MKVLKIVLCLLTALTVFANIVFALRNNGLDNTPPEITFQQDVLEVSVKADEGEYLAGVSAWDAQDGDLTKELLVEHISQLTGDGTVKITYGVFDRGGNGATATRTLVFTDYSGPEFQLSQPLRYRLGATVTLMDRLTAVDVLDGDITGRIRITSQSLSKDVSGVYHLGVQVTNSLGDTQILELPVIIEEVTANTPEIELSQYIVYLKRGDKFDAEDYLVKVTDAGETADASEVEIHGTVDTGTPDTYEVTYHYEGQQEETQVILTVVVRD